MLISLDTETTGLDLYHGCAPYLVTVAYEDGRTDWWSWPVDPLTRRVQPDEADLAEIRALIADEVNGCDRAGAAGGAGVGGSSGSSTETERRNAPPTIALQNSKFDVTALGAVGALPAGGWPWARTRDTLIAAHLLASNRPKDLTSLGVQYLGIDIQPYEDALHDACETARRYCRRHLPDWRIARAGLTEMPSAKERCWKVDGWLPAALCAEVGVNELSADLNRDVSSWQTVLQDYANADSATTLAVCRAMEAELHRRGLWRMYEERLKVLPIACRMEADGVTVSRPRLQEALKEYARQSETEGQRCLAVAARHNFPLELPASGNNKSLREFCFGALGLPVLKTSEKTGAPSLDKGVLESYEDVLPEGEQLEFVRALRAKRKRDTAIQYMESYMRFWQPLRYTNLGGLPVHNEQLDATDQNIVADWFVLHPSLNPTGTDTTRWSSSNPNEQNISKQEGFNLRSAFGPAPGREWWSTDAQNIELRLPAYESGERELIGLFEKPDEPPYYGSTHLLNFHTVYPDIWDRELAEVGLEKVGPHCKKKYASTYYQWVKNGGFAVQYGAVDREGGGGTADRAFHRVWAHARLKARFGKLEALNQKWIRFAEKHGYIETMPDRSVDPRRGYPLLCTRTEWGRILPTVPLNYHVQGTACWWMMRAMIRCQAQLDTWRQQRGFDGRMVLQVHDELVFDFPKSRPGPGGKPFNLWRINILRRLMEQGGEDIGVPTPTSCEYHAVSWAEGVSM